MGGNIESLTGKESCRIKLNGETVHDSSASADNLRAKIRELLEQLKPQQEQ